MDKEQVFDAEVQPVLDQLIKACEEKGIAFLATFDLSPRDAESMKCMTVGCADETGVPSPRLAMLRAIVMGEVQFVGGVSISAEDEAEGPTVH